MSATRESSVAMCAAPESHDARKFQTKSGGADWIRLFCAAVFCVALARFALLVAGGAVNVLYGDQWDFLAPMFEGRGPWASFERQHGPHRLGLGGLIQWFLYRATEWDARAEAWSGAVFLAAAAMIGMWISARLRGRPSAVDATWVLVCLGTMHWETLTLAPDIAHSVLPLLLIVTMAAGLACKNPRRRAAWLGLVGGLCVFTGFGVVGAVAAAVVATMLLSPKNESSERAAGGVVLACLGMAFAMFARGYRFDPAVPGWSFPVHDWWNYATFAGYMAATASGLRESSVPALCVGSAEVAAMLAATGVCACRLWIQGWQAWRGVVVLLCGSSLVYMTLTAVGRLPVNLEAAFMWRYSTLTATGLLGLVVWIDHMGAAGRNRVVRMMSLALAWGLALGAWSHTKPDWAAPGIGELKRRWVASYKTTRNLKRANAEADFGVYPADRDADFLELRLRWLEERKLSMFSDND